MNGFDAGITFVAIFAIAFYCVGMYLLKSREIKKFRPTPLLKKACAGLP